MNYITHKNTKKIFLIFYILILVAIPFINTAFPLGNDDSGEKENLSPSNTFITTVHGKKYLVEYITREKVEEMKKQYELIDLNRESNPKMMTQSELLVPNRESNPKMMTQTKLLVPNRESNYIINGHGTGYIPPSVDALENLIGKISLIDMIPEAGSPKFGDSADISTEIYFPVVGNQGGQGSCTAWANTYYAYGYMEAKDYGWDASSGNTDYLLSPAWVYNKVAAIDYGSAPVEVAQLMIDWGVSTLTTMPYNDADVDSWGDEPAWREAPYHRPLNYNPIIFSGPTTIDVIKGLLDSGVPVTFAIDANQFYGGGFADNWILSSSEYAYAPYSLNHAQCFVGYDDTITDDGDVGAFRVVNSWGSGWGDSGYYWVTYDAFSEFAVDPYQAILYYDDRIDYNPSLISTWEFSATPTRMDDIITLGVGLHESPFDTIIPLYDSDGVNLFPDFMALDISDFQSYYDVDPNVYFFLEIGSSTTTGTISSFLIERYVGGVLQEISTESPDVPKDTPGYVYGTFMVFDHELVVSLEVPTNPEIFISYMINATVTNNGLYDEWDVELLLYLDDILVNSIITPSLDVGASETINYLWTPSEYKTYNFTAYAPPVPGEASVSNNIRTELRYILTQLFFDDFESGLSQWDSITGLWHLTDTSSSWPDPCHSPTHSMWFGQEATGDYDTGYQELGDITTIPIDLSASDAAKLEFYHWREGEGGGYDVSYVYISTDGVNWDLLYQSSSSYIAPWQHVSLDISAYTGYSSVQIMFFFDTLDEWYNDYRGWLVDDIEILATGISNPHDLRVDLEVPDDPELYNTYTINATVTNIGENTEFDVELFLYLDESEVNSTIISTLPVGASETVTYEWTPLDYRTYNFTAYAPPVPDESFTGNNIATKLIYLIETKLFDGMFIDYDWTIFGEEMSAHFEWSYVSGSIFHTDWYMDSDYDYWDVDAQTRVMSNSGGSGWYFGNGYHTPLWIFTEISIEDQVLIAVDAVGDHLFEVSSELFYDLPGFGLIEIWELEDLTIPGGIAWYEKSTGILLNGTFFYDEFDPYYSYTFGFVDTNVEFTYVTFDHELKVSLDVPYNPEIGNSYMINATVTNNGLYDEYDVELFLYLDESEINSTTISTLSINESTTITYTWTPTEYRIYNFTAFTPPVVGESYIANNIVTKLIRISSLRNYIMIPDSPYNWIDASGGTELILDDDDYAAIALPFDFTFYNDTFSMIYLCSNGYLSFTDTMPWYYDNVPFPSANPDHTYMIAPFWDDLYPPYGGHIYVQSFETYWVAEWLDIYHISGYLLGSFEVILYETGEIVFNYDYIDYIDPYNGYTCGLNLGVDTDYYNSYLDLSDATDDFAIYFTYEQLEHDLYVSLEVPSSPDIGYTYTINATVTNNGLNDEYDVDLILYLDGVVVDSTTISYLPVDASETINYEWFPSDYGTYNFTAYAPPVPDETFIANNIITEILFIVYGNVILFDEAHLPGYSIGLNPALDVIGGYSEFAGMLTTAGYIVDTINPGTVIDATVLSECDILVIVASQNVYVASELDAIETWVENGGSLLLITDHTVFGTVMDSLAARFGFDFKNDIIFDSDDGVGTGDPSQLFYDGPNILAHPITTGVSRVEMYAGDGLFAAPGDETPIIITDTDGTATWYNEGTPALGVSVMSAVDGGSAGAGKVVVIGDCNLWDSAFDLDSDGDLDFYDSDNEILAWNTINWLTPTPSDSITVITPNSLSSWETGTSQEITWISTGSISDVKIELYKEGMFILEIVSSTTNDGSYIWDIPTDLEDGSDYQIKISDVSNPDTNDFSEDFEIYTPDSITVSTPDSSSSWEMGTSQEITWTSTGTISDVKIELYKDGVHILEIVASTTNDGSYTWAIPTDLEDGSDYQIKISDVSNPDIDDFSEDFEIYTPDSITVITPDSSSSWETGTSQEITWTSTGSISDVKIELYKDGELILEIVASTTNDGSYIWNIPTDLEDGSDYQIKISDVSNPDTNDFSDNFEIFTSPEEDSLTVTNPSTATAWEMGTSHAITWTSTGTISDVKIELYKDGVLILEIVASTTNDGSYTWTIPTDLEDGIDYQIKISDVANPDTYDESSNFAITSIPIPEDGGIPSYNIYILIGLICTGSVFLIKRHFKSIK